MNQPEQEIVSFPTFRSYMHIDKKGIYTEDGGSVSHHQLINAVIIRNKSGIVHIIKESSNAKVYPNRIVDHATLELKYVARFPMKLEVSEISGKIADAAIFVEGKKELDISQLSPGLYELTVKDHVEIQATIRFIKYKI